MARLPKGPITVALLALSAAALIAHMRVYAFVTDDAFISFVYSRNLAEHGQLVFNLGEKPVEGYTNFLWTVLLAGGMKLGWQPESSSIVCGTGFAIATLLVTALWSRRLRGESAWSPWDAVPALLLAAIPGYACWAAGGLETQLFTLLVTLGGLLYLAPVAAPLRPLSALCFGLAALTRPEGNLFFALAGLHRLLAMVAGRRLLPRRDELAWVATYLALVVPHFLWRHHYYGYWLPNTFYIKSSGGAGAIGRGLYYLWRVIDTYWLYALVVPPAIALFARADAATRRYLGFAGLVSAVFFLYVAAVGGDFMGLYRFALPAMPLLALAFALGLRTIARRLDEGGAIPGWATPAAVALFFVAYVWHDVGVTRAALVSLGPGASDNGIDTPGYLRWYTADRAAIGKWFGRYAQPDDYAAVGGAGAQVYYSRMKSLDCFGLSDEYIAHHVPPVSNRPGHQKYAPLEYQIARRPTIITSNYYNIGQAPLVREDAAEWRQRGYHYVSVQIPGLSSPWYTFLKRLDRTIGPLPADDAR